MDRFIRSKNIVKRNIFGIKGINKNDPEIFEDILSSRIIRIERIISAGQITSGNKWLSGKQDEWVILLKGKAEILFYKDNKILLKEGDYVFIPAGLKHRVTYTSRRPHCLWLAVHGKLVV
jgi:cupin 2 domain-containing protein